MLTENIPPAEPLTGYEQIPMIQDGQWVLAPLYTILNFPAPTLTATPTAFTATVISDSEIDLTWTSGAANFVLERCRENDQAWQQIYSGASNSFSDTLLYGDETYYYRVNAQDPGEFPSEWATTNATTDPLP